jgi:type II secretory pathway predicted ATPase ExeA
LSKLGLGLVPFRNAGVVLFFRLASRADTLSIVLAGHRKLKNDLRRPSIEEIGSRATIFEL